MPKIIDFFLQNVRLNYTILVFAFIAGVYSYVTISKEAFPPMDLKRIIIAGSYNGASPSTLDKMAVQKIENEISNISGITEVVSSITPDAFAIHVKLGESENEDRILQDVKDAVSLVRADLPSDMIEPTVRILKPTIPLIIINVSSKSKDDGDLMVQAAKKLKSHFSLIPDLTGIAIYGNTKKTVEMTVDLQKASAYGLDRSALLAALSGISSIFPVGNIEEKYQSFYVSTQKLSTAEEFLATQVRVKDKVIKLSDIAQIKKLYKNEDTISSFNGDFSLSINISKSKTGNAMELVKQIKAELESFAAEYPALSFGTFSDTSVYIKNRLNTVISNISLGLILVGFIMYILINKRISFVVIIGIPTSFVVSLIIFKYTGQSINLMNLLGALIAIGVLVDDAIIVAENIQRHVEEGRPIAQAAALGSKEVLTPVITSSLTTVFAFLPMLLIDGEMGAIIKQIPIAISILILASLVESFLFLPLHAKHILKQKDKELDWSPVFNLYERLINYLIRYKKTTVISFWILVPILIYVSFGWLKFSTFPDFDSDNINISGSLPPGTGLEKTAEVAASLERKILSLKDKYFIESTTAIAGFKMNPTGGAETKKNNFNIFIDLQKRQSHNFVDRYITPILSFESAPDGKRQMESYEIDKLLQGDLVAFANEHNISNFIVQAQEAGIVDNPIELLVYGENEAAVQRAIDTLTKALLDTNKTIGVGTDSKTGDQELKLRVNSYGTNLGITPSDLVRLLGGFYLDNAVSKSFDENGILELHLKTARKDELEAFKNFQITLADGRSVSLQDAVDIIYTQSEDKITKQDAKIRRMVFVSSLKLGVTSGEVLDEIDPVIARLNEDPLISIGFGGEEVQNRQLFTQMMEASVLALFLIFITLLITFNSFKITFMVISVIPLSLLGVSLGHLLMGMDLAMPSMLGALGLAGVVINDGIVMLDFIKNTKNTQELLERAKTRVRPIILTSVTTLMGLSTLIFFASGQAVILQPLAVSLGFGLFWGTVLNLFYLPALFSMLVHKGK